VDDEEYWPALVSSLRSRGCAEGRLRLTMDEAMYLLEHLGVFRYGRCLWQREDIDGCRLWGIPVELID